MNKGIHTRVSPIAYETEFLEDARSARAFHRGEIRRRKGFALSNVSAIGARLNRLASFFAFGGVPWVSYFDASGNLFVFEAPALIPAAGTPYVDCAVDQTSTVTVSGAATVTDVNQTYSFLAYTDLDPVHRWEWQGDTDNTWVLRLQWDTSTYGWTLTDGGSSSFDGTAVDLACVAATQELTWSNSPLSDAWTGDDATVQANS